MTYFRVLERFVGLSLMKVRTAKYLYRKQYLLVSTAFLFELMLALLIFGLKPDLFWYSKIVHKRVFLTKPNECIDVYYAYLYHILIWDSLNMMWDTKRLGSVNLSTKNLRFTLGKNIYGIPFSRSM